MSYDLLSEFADIVSAVAIVISLLFVGYQIAQNNKLLKVQQLQSNMAQLLDYKGLMLDPMYGLLHPSSELGLINKE